MTDHAQVIREALRSYAPSYVTPGGLKHWGAPMDALDALVAERDRLVAERQRLTDETDKGVRALWDEKNKFMEALEVEMAEKKALIAEECRVEELEAQLRAATDMLGAAEKIAPGLMQTAGRLAIGDVHEARSRAEAAEAEAEKWKRLQSEAAGRNAELRAYLGPDGFRSRVQAAEAEVARLREAPSSTNPSKGNDESKYTTDGMRADWPR